MIRFADKSTLLAAIIGMLVVGPAWSRDVAPQAGIVVEDLPYGSVLYEYYKQDYFSALTTLMVEEEFGRIPDHAAEAELLRGGLLLSYGLHSQAANIFERLLSADPAVDAASDGSDILSTREVRDRAWFFLGKMRFQRGYIAESGSALERAGPTLPAHLQAERDSLQAQVDIDQGNLAKAQRLIDQWQGAEDWAAYASYNLGVALLQADRFQDSSAYLERIGTMDATSDEMRSLRDRANLALGFARLRVEDGDAAKIALERIRLTGPFSGAALLGYGWAEAATGDYSAALVPWLELRDRKSIGPAYQESLLAIPYAYRKLSANQQAVEGYQDAIRTYDSEISLIDAAIEQASSGKLIRELLTEDIADFSRWNWTLSELPDTAEARYLYELIASHKFQTGLRNFRDLKMLTAHLSDWQGKLDIYGHMIESRELSYEASLEQSPEGMYAPEVEQLRSSYESIRRTVTAAAANHDALAVASALEADAWQRVTALESDASWAGASPEVIEKQRVLKGLLVWDTEKEYEFRLWEKQRELDVLEQQVAEVELNYQNFATEVEGVPAMLQNYEQRVETLTPRIEQLLNQVAEISEAQIDELGEVAAAELAIKKNRLLQYRAEAQFAQAAILDRSVQQEAQ